MSFPYEYKTDSTRLKLPISVGLYLNRLLFRQGLNKNFFLKFVIIVFQSGYKTSIELNRFSA